MYALRALCLRNRDESQAMQTDRLHTLVLMNRQLREDDFKMRDPSGGKHARTEASLYASQA